MVLFLVFSSIIAKENVDSDDDNYDDATYDQVYIRDARDERCPLQNLATHHPDTETSRDVATITRIQNPYYHEGDVEATDVGEGTSKKFQTQTCIEKSF